ncbi:MAG: pilus assembly protein PilP [bacterium]
MKKTEHLLLIVTLMVIMVFNGCKKSPVPSNVSTRNVVTPIPSIKPTTVAPTVSTSPTQVSTVTNTSTYYYNPAGKPDPFEPFDISKVKPTTALTPLQQFSLDQLTVRGIVWGVSNAKAIIEDPTGKTYIVGIGTKIGKNNGVIIRILNDKIVVLEQYTDVFTGKIKTNEVTMELKKTQKI